MFSRSLIDGGSVDLNKRDVWDSVPLYYACLAGHAEVVRCLLEGGAVCNEFTFDGDRCYYVSLNMQIRGILQEFEFRLPPLSPLGSALRSISAIDQPHKAEGLWCDFWFEVQQVGIPLHRAILSARSSYFQEMFQWRWRPEDGLQSKVVTINNQILASPAFKSFLWWMYTDRLDVSIQDVDDLQTILKKCKCEKLMECVAKEMSSINYYGFKQGRRPQKIVVNTSHGAKELRLSGHLRKLRRISKKIELKCRGMGIWEGTTLIEPEEDDLADLVLRVDQQGFRVHKCILASRSEFFRTLLQRWYDSISMENDELSLPCVEVTNINGETMEMVLRYVYADSIKHFPTSMLQVENVQLLFEAADRLLIFPMKKLVAQELISRLKVKDPLKRILELLLLADEYDVDILRDHFLEVLSARFDNLVSLSHKHFTQDQILFLQFIQATEIEVAEGGTKCGLLDDLRIKYLEKFSGKNDERQLYASQYVYRLEMFRKEGSKDNTY